MYSLTGHTANRMPKIACFGSLAMVCAGRDGRRFLGTLAAEQTCEKGHQRPLLISRLSIPDVLPLLFEFPFTGGLISRGFLE